MRDIRAWLKDIGLARFAEAFEENEIDFEALPYLTDNMLLQIGMPIGPRAKLLAEISKLTAAAADAQSAKSTEAAPLSQPRQSERRQITIMFCDLVGSTTLAERLDPEDFSSVMEAYQKVCGVIIKRYDGHVSQYRGDGIEAYFGWPSAREDAAERAVRVGLEIIAAVNAISVASPLSVRIGISTGIVVVGDTGSGDPSVPSSAVGDTPHIAARLQSLASPDSIIISEATSRLVAGRFDQESLGPKTLKGIADPVQAFLVHGVRDNSSRFQAVHAKMRTPLVGRTAEMAFLQQRWEDAKEGEGQAVFVSGIPGVGKSRIAYELEERLGEPHFSLTFQCLEHCMQSALFPVIQQIQRLGGLKVNDTDEAKLDKIEQLSLLATLRPESAVPFIAQMLSIPLGSRYRLPTSSAQQTKDQTVFILVELLRGLSKRRPIFCLFEDVHWIDPSTQELLDLIVGEIEKARMLLVATHRPEYRVRSHGNISGLTIGRLKRQDAVEMVRLVLGDRLIATGTESKLVDESDSIPLFVEELARGAIEANRASSGLSNRRTTPLDARSVPELLRDSLAARLERVPIARNVAQMAAVIGREFSYDILLHITSPSLSPQELDMTLAHLIENDIVRRIDNGPPARYGFKHALLGDAAYESLLRSSRREIHTSIASFIEKGSPDTVAEQPELLAYHYGLGGNSEAAVHYWLMGGHRARSRSANLEAIAQYRKALEFFKALADMPERHSIELEIHSSLGLCLIAVQGYSSDETRLTFELSRRLSAQLGEQRKELQAIFGLWGHWWMRADHHRAIELAETLLAKGAQLGDLMALILGHRAVGSTLFTLGNFLRARQHLEQAVTLGQQTSSGEILSYAVDPRIAAQLMLGWDLWMLGYPDQALNQVLEALSQATKGSDVYTAAFAHYVSSAVQLLRGEFQASLANADRSLALSKEHRIGLYTIYSRFGRGCALARLGRLDLATSEIKEGVAEAVRNNLGYMRGFMYGWLATSQSEAGELDLGALDYAGSIGPNERRHWTRLGG